MNNKRFWHLKIVMISLCLLSFSAATAAPPSPPPSKAECDAGLNVTSSPMGFGDYIGGTAGTIVMDPDTGALTAVGVFLLGGGVGSPQSFIFTNSVPGCEKKNVTMTLPASITINNAGTGVVINSLLSNIGNKKFKIPNPGSVEVTIGGTLNAGSTDPNGLYSGSYDVIFSY